MFYKPRKIWICLEKEEALLLLTRLFHWREREHMNLLFCDSRRWTYEFVSTITLQFPFNSIWPLVYLLVKDGGDDVTVEAKELADEGLQREKRERGMTRFCWRERRYPKISSNTDLTIHLELMAEIYLWGDMRRDSWGEDLSPTLSFPLGFCVLIWFQLNGRIALRSSIQKQIFVACASLWDFCTT